MQPSVGIVLSEALGLYSLRRITSNPGAGNLLSEVRVFDRALVISLRKMFFFSASEYGAFSVVHFRPSNLSDFQIFQISLPARRAGRKRTAAGARSRSRTGSQTVRLANFFKSSSFHLRGTELGPSEDHKRLADTV